MANLKNINFMSKTRFDSTTPSDDELYFVDFGDIDFVVESYDDDNGNWYRVYKSGWVEQGGFVESNISISGNSSTKVTINLLYSFINTKYFVCAQKEGGNLGVLQGVGNKKITNFVCNFQQYSGNTGNTDSISWYACGMGA
jgi:hypothetical protein